MKIRTTTTEITATTETASNPNPSPSADRPDPGAAGALVSRLFTDHGRMVLGLCRLLLRDSLEAEDAAQQVFLSAHSAVLRGSAPREEHAWLAAIARNECRARIHARMREPLVPSDLPSDLPDPLAAAICAADLDAIWAAISSLPRRQRRVFLLREVGGLSYHELGRALRVSQSSVESLLFRARRQVRSLIAASAPLALRDDLARRIPGFDPGSAGLVARVATLPVGLKLATAAVSVGVVSTGAAQFPEYHGLPTIKSRTAALHAPVARADPLERTQTVLVAARRASATSERHGQEGHELREHEQGLRGETQQQHEREPAAEQEPVEPEPAELDSVAVLERHDGGSSNSGPGSGGSGSNHSGSSSGGSLSDGSGD